MMVPDEITCLFLFLLHLFELVRLEQCPASRIVHFDIVRPITKTPQFCAVANADVKQAGNKNLKQCSRDCGDDEACIGFNHLEPQLFCVMFQTPFTSLILRPGCAYYQKRNTSVSLPQAGCYVRLHGWGLVPGAPQEDWFTALAINDVVYVNATCSEPLGARGFHTYLVHPNDCTASDFQHFDPSTHFSESYRFINYLQSLADGEILVGFSADDVVEHLLDHFIVDARYTLLTLTGVDVRPIVFRGKFVFIGQIGSPQIAASAHMTRCPYEIKIPSKTRRPQNVGSPQKAVYN